MNTEAPKKETTLMNAITRISKILDELSVERQQRCLDALKNVVEDKIETAETAEA